MRWKWYVYIIECKDGHYYTGFTWNLENRILQHRCGNGSKFTAKHGFLRLAYFEEFEDFLEGKRREMQIKGWTRLKKERLISGEWMKDW